MHRLSPEQLREREPHVASVASILLPPPESPSFRQVALTYAKLVAERGGTLLLNCRVTGIRSDGAEQVIETTHGPYSHPIPCELRRPAQRPNRAVGG